MMLAAAETQDGKKLLLLGLSRANVERLMAGEDIKVPVLPTSSGWPQNWEVKITFGETEMAMQLHLVASGLIDSKTKIEIDKRLMEGN
jgi:hypothetical protein